MEFRFHTPRETCSKFEEKQVFLPLVFLFTLNSTCNWFYTEKQSPVPYTFTPLSIVCEVLGRKLS